MIPGGSPLDRTNQVYADVLKFLAENDLIQDLESVRWIGLDLETTGIVKNKDTGHAIRAQADIHKTPVEHKILTAELEAAEYRAKYLNRGKVEFEPQSSFAKHFVLKHRIKDVEKVLQETAADIVFTPYGVKSYPELLGYAEEQKILFSPEEFAKEVSKLLTPGSKGQKIILFGHNVANFDLRMLQSLPGYEGIKDKIAIVDTYELVRRLFPELNVSRSGPYKLENLRAFIEESLGLKKANIVKGGNKPTGLTARQFYGRDAPEEFIQAWKRVVDEFLEGDLAGSHRSDVDVLVSKILLEASRLRATTSEKAKGVFIDYLMEQGVITGLPIPVLLRHRQHLDKYGLSVVLPADRISEIADKLVKAGKEGFVLPWDESTKLYNIHSSKKLMEEISVQYGAPMAERIEEFRKTLVKKVGKVPGMVFMTRKIAGTEAVGLYVGRLGEPASFIPLPLQGSGIGTGGILVRGEKLYKTYSLGKTTAEGLTRISYTEEFYKNLITALTRKVKGEEIIVTAQNLQDALRNIYSKAKTLTLQELREAYPFARLEADSLIKEGRLQMRASMFSGLTTVLGPGEQEELYKLIRRVQDTAGERSRIIGRAFGSGKGTGTLFGSKFLEAERQHQKAVEDLANFLRQMPGGAGVLAYTKAEHIATADTGSIKVAHPILGRLMGLSPDVAALAKGKAHIARGEDIPFWTVEEFEREGRFVGRPIITALEAQALEEQKRHPLFAVEVNKGLEARLKYAPATQVEGSVLFVQNLNKAGLWEAAVYGDSGILATGKGARLLRRPVKFREIRLADITERDLKALAGIFAPGDTRQAEKIRRFKTNLRRNIAFIDPKGARIREDRIPDDIVDLLKRRIKVDVSKAGIKESTLGELNRVLKEAKRESTGGVYLTHAFFDEENALVLRFESGLDKIPHRDPILLGPSGGSRQLVTGLAPDISINVGGIVSPVDIVAPSSAFASSTPKEILLEHRVNLARRLKTNKGISLLEYLVSREGRKLQLKRNLTSEFGTVVLPEGMDMDEALRITEGWLKIIERGIRDVGEETAREFREGFEGIRVNIPEEYQAAVGGKLGLAFFTSITRRADAVTDVSSSIYRAKELTIKQALKVIGKRIQIGGVEDPFARIIRKEFRRQRGVIITDSGEVLLEEGRKKLSRYRELFSFFIPTEKIPVQETLKKVYVIGINKEGRFVIKHAPSGSKYSKGTILTAAPDYIDAPTNINALTGTVLDPEIVRTGAVLELPGTGVNVTYERGRGTVTRRIKYIPILGAPVTDIGTGRTIEYRRHSLGSLLSTLLTHVREGKTAYFPRGRVGGLTYNTFSEGLTVYMLEAASRYKKALADLRIDLVGFSARVAHAPPALTPLGKELLHGVRLNPDDLFVSYMTKEEFEAFAKKKFALDSKVAKKLIDTASHRGYLKAVVSADPALSAGHFFLTKIKIVDKETARRLRGTVDSGSVDLMLNSYMAYRIDRDLDKDTVNVFLLDVLEDQREGFPGYPSEVSDFDAFYTAQAEASVDDYYKTYFSRLEQATPDDIKEIIEEISEGLTGGEKARLSKFFGQVNKETLAALMAMKSRASLAYTLLADPIRLLNVAATNDLSQENLELMIKALAKSGGNTSRAAEAIAGLGREKATAAMELLRQVYQAGIQKMGKGAPAQNALVQSMLDLISSKEPGTVEQFIEVMTSAYEDFLKGIEEAGLKVIEGEQSAVISEMVRSGQATTRRAAHAALVGEALGRVLYASRNIRGRVSDITQVITRSTLSLDEILRGILGLTDVDIRSSEATAEVETGIESMAEAAEREKQALEAGAEVAKRAAEKVGGFFETRGKLITTVGLLGLGAYVLFSTFDHDDRELEPPLEENIIGLGSPLPPSPRLELPTDTGYRGPEVRMRPVARVAMSAPPPAVYPGRPAKFNMDIVSSPFTANSIDVIHRDELDPISKEQIRRRMHDVANADFVR